MTAEIGVNCQELMDDLGIFADLPDPWEGIEMKCPTCGDNTPDKWQPFWPDNRLWGDSSPRAAASKASPTLDLGPIFSSFKLEYMFCAAEGCNQAIVRAHETLATMEPLHDGWQPTDIKRTTTTWVIYPRHVTRPLDALVTDPYRRDYLEAAAILDISPRASALLARRILEHLLEDFAGGTGNSLNAKIEKFNAEPGRPSEIKAYLHDVREMADLVAHPKRDLGSGALIDVSLEEADWTLSIVDRLFDYFIIDPARTKARQAEMDSKLKRAGRTPLKREDNDGKIKP